MLILVCLTQAISLPWQLASHAKLKLIKAVLSADKTEKNLQQMKVNFDKSSTAMPIVFDL